MLALEGTGINRRTWRKLTMTDFYAACARTNYSDKLLRTLDIWTSHCSADGGFGDHKKFWKMTEDEDLALEILERRSLSGVFFRGCNTVPVGDFVLKRNISVSIDPAVAYNFADGFYGHRRSPTIWVLKTKAMPIKYGFESDGRLGNWRDEREAIVPMTIKFQIEDVVPLANRLPIWGLPMNYCPVTVVFASEIESWA